MKQKRIQKVLFLAVALVFLIAASSWAVQGTPLPGSKIPQFVDPLPLLDLTASGTIGIDTIIAGPDEIRLSMCTFKANIMPSTFVPANGLPYTGTWTFGYIYNQDCSTGPLNITRATPVGPVIVATRGNPTQIRYVNNLEASDSTIHWRDWIDQSLHSAFHQIYGIDMPTLGNSAPYLGPVPAVPHLHGGEVPAVIDGGPEAYFLSNLGDFAGVVNTRGPAYYTHPNVPAVFNEAVYRYPNSQEAAPLWFHDHLLGGTRLNATYAGLAGAYPIIDPALVLPSGLDPVGLGGRPLIPLVIQDRMFDTNGQLYFPNIGINPEHPYWVPEFVGDTIVVNGKVWPYLNVDRQRYRFLIINGSNSRPYDMYLIDRVSGVKGPRMWVIATDGGYLDTPVLIDPNATGQQKKAGVQKSLLMMPGERYEIIVDFNDPTWVNAITAAYAAMGMAVPNPVKLTLRNTAPTVLGPPNARTDGRIMEFRVSANAPIDNSYNPASGIPIRSGNQKIVRLPGTPGGPAITPSNVQKVRELTLNEVMGAGGPLEVLVNNSKWNGLRPDNTPIPGSMLVNNNYVTELPNEGDTEVWEIVNLTADAHPIHLHGVQFQIVNRQKFDLVGYTNAYAAAFPGGVYSPASGPPLPYDPISNPLSGGKYGGNPDVTPYLQGPAQPPLPYEQGWKDTAIMPPGMVTRIAVRFAPQDTPVGIQACFPFNPSAPINPLEPILNQIPGYYVWHCHITDHEDNEMMRPYEFIPASYCQRTYQQGIDY